MPLPPEEVNWMQPGCNRSDLAQWLACEPAWSVYGSRTHCFATCRCNRCRRTKVEAALYQGGATDGSSQCAFDVVASILSHSSPFWSLVDVVGDPDVSCFLKITVKTCAGDALDEIYISASECTIGP
eukprot:3437381-Amphidinium_carterae.2